MIWPPEGQLIDADGHTIVGETLRDRFAMSAMAALISDGSSLAIASKIGTPLAEQIASWSYEFADAMLEQRGVDRDG